MPTTQTLTPTQFVKNGAGLNLTPLLTAPTQQTLVFSNSGREILLVEATAAGVTVQVDIGVTVLGQAVTNFPTVTLTESDVYAFGPFDSQVDQPGTGQVEVALSATSGVNVVLMQVPGAA